MMPETAMLENPGRYQRLIDPEGKDSLSVIARRIAPNSQVLDLGTGPGALGAYLAAEKGCTVDGVDCDPEAARLACGFYRDFFQADLEQARLSDLLAGRRYQVIVCADVIEHLRDPGALLSQLPALLHPSGRVLLSVPNVSYCGVLGELLEGKFRYRPSGLLDSTHLRFFTRDSLLELLREHGLHPVHLAAVIQDPAGSEFDTCFNALPRKIQQTLLSRPDALSYQFLVEAGVEPASPVQIGDLEPVPAAWPFVAQLYWRRAGEDFTETASVAVEARMEEQRQTLRFPIPPLERPVELRLDPADRPGFLHLFGLRLLAVGGVTLWQPKLRQFAEGLQSSQLLAAPIDTEESLTLLLAGTDPAFHLPIPEQALAGLGNGGILELELAWPASADFLRLGETLQLQMAEYESRLKAQGVALAKKEERILSLEGIIAPRTAEIVSLRHQNEELAGALRQAHEQISALENEKDAAARRLDEIEAANGELSRHLAEAKHFAEALQATLSWRWTAPFRWWRSKVRKFTAAGRQLLIRRKCRLVFVPWQDLESLENGKFLSTGNDPQFFLQSADGPLPTGWCRFFLRGQGFAQPLTPVLFIDDGGGFREESKITLPTPENDTVDCLIRLTDRVEALRLDPCAMPGEFRLDEVYIRETRRSSIVARFLLRLFRQGISHPPDLTRAVRRAWGTYLQAGHAGLKAALVRQFMVGTDPASDYRRWIQLYDSLTDTDRAAIGRHIASLPLTPVISVVMPTYNTPEKWLRKAIESVRRQLYPYWELCIADDASTQGHVRKVLEDYQARDPRIKINFRSQNGHISAASNSALELADGEFVALLDHDDEIPEHALYLVAVEINKHPGADLIYSDEDKINERGERFDPYFKSDWNPDLFYSHNMISHFGVYRSDLVRAVGGFRPGFEGSQDYDLALRAIEGIGTEKIRHIPRVLYHWRAINGSTALNPQQKSYAEIAARKAIQSHFERTGSPAKILPGPSGGLHRALYPLPPEAPLVSIIIPTRDGYSLLSTCLRGLREETDYPNLEIIVADNRTTCPRTLELLEEVRTYGKVVDCDFEFNFSRINNRAVAEARGGIACFLNNDIEIINPQWLREMVSHILRPEIGVVGAKLYYQDQRIQHAGIILGMGRDRIAGTPHQGGGRQDLGYFGKAALLQNFSAVTAACMAVRKEVFLAAGGFDEKLSVAFNDVDFCLRLLHAGYRIIWTPYAELLHHESATRGYENDPDKKARFDREADFMRQQWDSLLAADPFFNPNLSLDRSDLALAFPPRTGTAWKCFL